MIRVVEVKIDPGGVSDSAVVQVNAVAVVAVTL
jgi:type IV pilus biogenesis protein CpaD/CtpE